ncbi:MAG: protein TolR [Alphaproteobacteria bacterium]|nr:protein TolR [Alphaproteobacteria bacterium]
MGANLNSGKTQGRQSYRPMAEINVTPFVDVMLVLLVVFMVAAPLLTAGVPIDLPDSKAKALQEEDNKPLEVSLDKEGKIYVGDTEVKQVRLVSLLASLTNNDPDRRIYIRADEDLDYGEVMGILGAINGAGFKKVALISNSSTKTP